MTKITDKIDSSSINWMGNTHYPYISVLSCCFCVYHVQYHVKKNHNLVENVHLQEWDQILSIRNFSNNNQSARLGKINTNIKTAVQYKCFFRTRLWSIVAERSGSTFVIDDHDITLETIISAQWCKHKWFVCVGRSSWNPTVSHFSVAVKFWTLLIGIFFWSKCGNLTRGYTLHIKKIWQYVFEFSRRE